MRSECCADCPCSVVCEIEYPCPAGFRSSQRGGATGCRHGGACGRGDGQTGHEASDVRRCKRIAAAGMVRGGVCRWRHTGGAVFDIRHTGGVVHVPVRVNLSRRCLSRAFRRRSRALPGGRRRFGGERGAVVPPVELYRDRADRKGAGIGRAHFGSHHRARRSQRQGRRPARQRRSGRARAWSTRCATATWST